MAPLASRPLPGIRFAGDPPPPAAVLPRMDIAAFVGFAASGPIDVPVAVEDAARFADVFGADAPLAWDLQRAEPVHAQLGPAVRAFFRNGGRRCWVVRVADTGQAASDRFQVPGLVALDADGAHAPALLRARSRGSWADGLRVTALLEPTLLPLGPGPALQVLAARPDAVAAGDLLRLSFPGSPWTRLVVAGSVAPSAVAAPPVIADGARLVRLDVTPALEQWLRPATLTAGVAGSVSFVAGDGADATASVTVLAGGAGELTRLLLAAGAEAPPPGAVLRGTFPAGAVLLDVVAVEAAAGGACALVVAATELAAAPPAPPAAPDYAERLTLRLRVEGGDRPATELGGLGFAPAHPRFLGALPDDEALYGAAVLRGEPARFALAGPESPPALYLPLGASIAAGPAAAALRPHGDERERDGLGGFRDSVFLDEALGTLPAERLLEESRWVRDQSPAARPLRGIHALLGNDEVTLVAVPDAIQSGWRGADAVPVPAPQPAPDPAPPDWASFLDCATHVLAAPELEPPGARRPGGFRLSWTATDAGDAEYELQEASDPGFAIADTLYRGPERAFDVYARPDGSVIYYQVRAVAGARTSAWSNRIAVDVAPASRSIALEPDAYSAAALLRIQRALVRMCAARGDMLALLALPEHYGAAAAGAHARTLTGPEPSAIFSYGALYHPWLLVSEPEHPRTLRRISPDGAAAGVMAARAFRRGAWVAPANEPLRDVLDLDPPIAPESHQALQDAQVNLVRHDPRGFLWLAADTLSGDEELRPIGVRRLLALLRRAALRSGEAMTFASNDDVARRAVRRSFEALLGGMFERGAFAGRVASDGFRVVTPASQADLDDGRLVVELRVAPSVPLAFLTVRFLRTGGDGLAMEVQAR